MTREPSIRSHLGHGGYPSPNPSMAPAEAGGMSMRCPKGHALAAYAAQLSSAMLFSYPHHIKICEKRKSGRNRCFLYHLLTGRRIFYPFWLIFDGRILS